MKIIGITGGIGSGKSTVSLEFESYGAEIIDADAISRSITLKKGLAYREIVEFFGEDIICNSGEIDRKKLAGIVFSDAEKLEVLNNITHKYIFEEMENRISSSKNDLVILDVPLLFSPDFKIECDIKIVVVADLENRINRVIKRDNTDRISVENRINSQLSDEEMKKLADIVIENDSLDDMKKQVKKIVEMLRGNI